MPHDVAAGGNGGFFQLCYGSEPLLGGAVYDRMLAAPECGYWCHLLGENKIAGFPEVVDYRVIRFIVAKTGVFSGFGGLISLSSTGTTTPIPALPDSS